MHERKAAAGQFHGGRRRFGYNADMTATDETEAAEIVNAATRVLAGESLTSITADWNARGITTPTGKEWRSPNLGKMLRGPHLAALRVHGDTTTAAAWPAILDAATHEALVRFMGAPDRRHSGFTGTRVYPFTGVVRCGVCDGPLYGRPTPLKSGPAFVCRNGQHVQAPVATVAAIIRANVVERLSRVDASGVWIDPADADRANARAAERIALAERRAALPGLMASGALSPEDFAAGVAAIDARAAQLDDEAVADDDAARLPARVLDGLTGHPADMTEELWDALPDDRQRAVVAVLGTPVLGKASRKGRGLEFEPERVTWRWADA